MTKTLRSQVHDAILHKTSRKEIDAIIDTLLDYLQSLEERIESLESIKLNDNDKSYSDLNRNMDL